MIKIIFAIINIVIFMIIPHSVYFPVGFIAAVIILYLDLPRIKSILKSLGFEEAPMCLYVVVELCLSTVAWIYTLLSFTYLVFSGKWERELNGKL